MGYVLIFIMKCVLKSMYIAVSMISEDHIQKGRIGISTLYNNFYQEATREFAVYVLQMYNMANFIFTIIHFSLKRFN